jgi:hypothetical protein
VVKPVHHQQRNWFDSWPACVQTCSWERWRCIGEISWYIGWFIGETKYRNKEGIGVDLNTKVPKGWFSHMVVPYVCSIDVYLVEAWSAHWLDLQPSLDPLFLRPIVNLNMLLIPSYSNSNIGGKVGNLDIILKEYIWDLYIYNLYVVNIIRNLLETRFYLFVCDYNIPTSSCILIVKLKLLSISLIFNECSASPLHIRHVIYTIYIYIHIHVYYTIYRIPRVNFIF